MTIKTFFITFFLVVGIITTGSLLTYGLIHLPFFVYEKIKKMCSKRKKQNEDDEYFLLTTEDKINKNEVHIKNIINKCETHEQLRYTREWLYGYYHRMIEFYTTKGITKKTCSLFFLSRMYRHLDAIHEKHNELSENNILA